MNFTMVFNQSRHKEKVEFTVFRNCVDLLIIACTLFGNVLIISSIGRVRKLRRVFSSVLVMNLAFCDILLVFFSIPGDIIESHAASYPFNRIGCKLISPIATYYVNTIAITLTLISIERYLAIRFNFKFRGGTRKKVTIVMIIHLVALVIVIPYMTNIDILKSKDGGLSCGERWSAETKKMYTIVLFLVQFGIPLPIIFILYTLSWRTIQKRNSKTIRVLTNINKRSMPTCSQCCYHNKSELPTCGHRKRLNSKLTVTSEVSIARQKQTKYYLKMFTAVVILFTVCMMPNQITWFYLAFKPRPLNPYIEVFFYWLTYANGVLNPWIYAGFNPYFKQAYRNFVKKFLSPCFKEELTMKGKRLDTMIFHQNNSASTPSDLSRGPELKSGNEFLWNTPWNTADKRPNYKSSLSSLSDLDDDMINVYFDVPENCHKPKMRSGPHKTSRVVSAAILSSYDMVLDYVQLKRASSNQLIKTKRTGKYSDNKEEEWSPSWLLNTHSLDERLTEHLQNLTFNDFDELSETLC